MVSYVQLVAQWLKRPPPRPFLHTHLDLYNHTILLRLIRSKLIAARSCCLGPFRQIFTIILLLFLWSWKMKGKKTWRSQYQLLSSWESSKWLKGTKTKDWNETDNKQLIDSVIVISKIIKVSQVLSAHVDNTYCDLHYSGYHKYQIK